MELGIYLMKKKILAKEFAKKIAISNLHLQNIINGKVKPGAALTRLIEWETRGLVKFEDFQRTESEFFNIYGKESQLNKLTKGKGKV